MVFAITTVVWHSITYLRASIVQAILRVIDHNTTWGFFAFTAFCIAGLFDDSTASSRTSMPCNGHGVQ